jgi:hypothetical protein
MLTDSHLPASARALAAWSDNRSGGTLGQTTRSPEYCPADPSGVQGVTVRGTSVRSQRMGLTHYPGGGLPGMDRVNLMGFA